MHSIERYGIVALLFLVVTVVAVLMWDGKKKGQGSPAAEPGAAPVTEEAAAQAKRPGLPGADEGRLTLELESQPGPLFRESPAARGSPEDATGGATRDEHAPPQVEPAEPDVPSELALPSGAGEALEARAGSPAADAREETAGPVPAGSALSAAAPLASMPDPLARRYSVRPGDTLSEIAQRELGSARRWKEIVARNPRLDPARLPIGTEIELPPGQGTRSAAARTALSAKSDETAKRAHRTWTVGKGESLWKIAERALGKGERWREIVALNPGLDPGRLREGSVLRLPGSTAPKTAAGKKGSTALVASSSERAPAEGRGGRVK